jgi:hypothetical protein
MSPTVTPADPIDTDRIDTDISIAGVALGVARASYARCPSGENARALDRAVAAVDRLLDERLAARP